MEITFCILTLFSPELFYRIIYISTLSEQGVVKDISTTNQKTLQMAGFGRKLAITH